MIKPISKVSSHRKKYKIKNYKDLTFKAKNLTVCQDKIDNGVLLYNALVYIPKATVVTQFFSVDNKHFFINDQSGVYMCQYGSCSKVGEINSPIVSFLPVKIYGQKEVLVADEFGAFIIGQDERIANFPMCKTLCFHNGRIFTAIDNTITFFNQFDMENNSVSFTVAGTIALDKDAGEIQGFMSNGENLYCICNNAIFKITCADENINFKVQREDIFGLDIKDKSFASNFGQCFFISCGKLYIFDGNLKSKDMLLNNFDFTIVNNAKYNKNHYVLTAKDDEKNKFCYIFDLLTENESMIYPNEDIIAGEKYIVVDGVAKELFRGASLQDKKFISNPIIMADGISTVCSMSVEVGSACTLKISGDFGNKYYSLTSGFNDILVNLSSRSLKLEFTAQNQNFFIDNLCIVYKQRGE